MKNQVNFRFIFLVLVSVFFVSTAFQNLNAQTKKNKVRLKADYVKIMDGEMYLNISASSKINKKNIKISGIELTVLNEINDENHILGKVITNIKGETKFLLKGINSITPDSTSTYNLIVLFKGNDTIKKAKKSVSFKNAEIRAKHIIKDRINYITASLIDTNTTNPISNESLDVQVQRLFNPLKIGDEFNYTDENGTIIIPVEDGIPGINGELIFEVVLSDSDLYGTIKAIFETSIGSPIVNESTYEQRTLWAPRNKTPLFILIFANLLIIGMWGTIIYLITNLFKIKKT